MKPASDAELWDRTRAGDPDAFGVLFERLGPRLHAYLLRRTAEPSQAEDLLAIVFLEAWRRREALELTQPSPLPWLYGVAANVVRQQRRSRRRHDAALARLHALPPPSPALVERQVQAAAEAASVLAQLRRLSRRDQEVLVLAAFEGLSHAEIAAALGTSVGTVKSRLSRARARLDRDARLSTPEHPPPDPSTSPPRPTTSLTLKETGP